MKKNNININNEEITEKIKEDDKNKITELSKDEEKFNSENQKIY